jgi:hypothetical protein
VISIILKDHVAFTFRVNEAKKTACHYRRQNDALKRQNHSPNNTVTSHRTRIFSNAIPRTSYLHSQFI